MTINKKKRRLRLQSNALEYADIDYLDKLNDVDRDFMLDFVDGYYNNNHRKYEIFTENENYESIKKDIYGMTNARNRCGQSRDKTKGSIVELDKPVFDDEKMKLENLLRDAYKDNKDDDILSVLGVTGFEEKAETLIDDTLHSISNFNNDHKVILIRFFIRMKNLVKDEKKRLLNEKKIAKEREER